MELEEYKERKVKEILALPAINAVRGAEIYEPFILRDKEEGISWNENVLRGACMLNMSLANAIWNITWKNTVKEQYWWDDMSHEDILAGKWKELI